MTKKKIVSLCLAAVLVVMAIAGATMAYFTDTKTADNTFTVGNVKIVLDEALVDNEGHAVTGEKAERVTGNDYGIEAVYPGATLDKDPTVKNTGKNPAYIRATVNVSNWMVLCDTFYPEFGKTYPAEGYEQSLKLLVGDLGEGWTIESVTTGDNYGFTGTLIMDAKFVLKYDKVLQPGESTTAMFSHVMIPTNVGAPAANGAVPSFESFNEMKIVAQAIQANSFDTWEAAFTAFDGQ